MKEELVQQFLERVKKEANLHKFLEEKLIYQLIDCFKKDYEKVTYPKNIGSPLEVALQFYKFYNIDYYKMILHGISNRKIIINDNFKNSFVDTGNNNAYIRLFGNDSDVYCLVHEFAHFIDRNSNPVMIPDEYNFLCEVFSFYMEKQLELWLTEAKYDELIRAKKNNRMYFESRMLKSVEYQLSCETLYKKNGQIALNNLESSKIKSIMNYHYDLEVGLINYLLRYPLANILSEYLISNQLVQCDRDIWKVCLNTDLYDVLKSFRMKTR